MKQLVVCVSLLTLVSAASFGNEDFEFHDWKIKFEKSYSSSSEEAYRKNVWLKNRKYVIAHNMLADQDLKSFRLGMTYFADLENEEYRKMILGGCLKEYKSKQNESTTEQVIEVGVSVPSSIDWRQKGYVTPVKNQGSCGSCWAFSATGALEGQNFRKTKHLVSLSEQQLVDCSKGYGNQGCGGGWMDHAFQYIKENKGIDTEGAYPYKGIDNRCQFNPSKIGATCTGYKDITKGSERALQNAVGTIGPVSVAIDASQPTFQMYQSGIYDEPECSSTSLDHGVLAVGYGSSNGRDYWIIKNSWGVRWGHNGYIYMSRNKQNQCGIATAASYPTV